MKFLTCSCNSQSFSLRDKHNKRNLDVLECSNCGKLWLRRELRKENIKKFYWICPICKANFYHPSLVEFHYKIAHKEVEVIVQ